MKVHCHSITVILRIAIIGAAITGPLAAVVADTDFTRNAEDMKEYISSLPYIGASPPVIGTNVEGTSVFTNMMNAIRDGQFFFHSLSAVHYEKPDAPIHTPTGVYWCSSVQPSTKILNPEPVSISVSPAYSATCLYAPLKDQSKQIESANGDVQQLKVQEFGATNSFSAIFVPEQNGFFGTLHAHADNYVRNVWDDGTGTMPQIGYELIDEMAGPGKSWSGYGAYKWITANETAILMDFDVDGFTTEHFENLYKRIYSGDPKADFSSSSARGARSLFSGRTSFSFVGQSLFFFALTAVGRQFCW